MNVLPLAVLLVAATSPVGREPDPPHVVAMKERQKQVQTFEVVLSVKKEWKGVAQYQSTERKDFSAAGTIKFVVDGKRYWYFTDVPMLNGFRDRVVRQRHEIGFDGRIARTRYDFELLKGERAGQLVPMSQVITLASSAGWWQTSEPNQPFEWLLRGFGRSLEKTEADTIDGVRCERYRTDPRFPDGSLTVWLDPHAGYVPHRVVTNHGKLVTQLAYHATGSPGWVPGGWVTTDQSNPKRMISEITTVTVESFAVRESIPNERFAVKFQAGTQVVRADGNNLPLTYTVAENGSLVENTPPEPKAEPPYSPPSLGFTLSVVGTTLAVFVALAALLRWMTREQPADGRSL